jgi:hypothetical protein
MASAPAQPAPGDPPKPPFIAAKAPASSHWTVDFTYASAGDARPTAPKLAGKRILKSDLVRTGEIKRQSDAYEEGGRQDLWTSGSALVLEEPGYAHKIVRRILAADTDFPEFLWLKEAEYQGRERVEGRDCFVFASELHPLQLADPSLYAAVLASPVDTIDLGSKVPVKACIEAESRLPVKLIVGGDSRTYTFLAPPAAPLVLPPAYAAALQDVEARYRAIVKPLARP